MRMCSGCINSRDVLITDGEAESSQPECFIMWRVLGTARNYEMYATR
jgi:hypothetical protein